MKKLVLKRFLTAALVTMSLSAHATDLVDVKNYVCKASLSPRPGQLLAYIALAGNTVTSVHYKDSSLGMENSPIKPTRLINRGSGFYRAVVFDPRNPQHKNEVLNFEVNNQSIRKVEITYVRGEFGEVAVAVCKATIREQ